MSVAQFPDPTNGGPRYGTAIQDPDTFQVTVSEYDDGGKDFALQAGGTGVKRWLIEYPALTRTEAATLDSHNLSAAYNPDQGSAQGFNFFWRDDSTTYGNVHYAPGGYVKRVQRNKQIQTRTVILEKHP